LRGRRTFSIVVVRESGRSRIPETSAIESMGRGVLDTPHARIGVKMFLDVGIDL